MSTILELTEKRKQAWDAAKAFLNAKRNDQGVVSAEDAATYEKMEAEVQALTTEIERLTRQAAIDEKLAQATSEPITNRPSAKSVKEKTGRAADVYREGMLDALRTNFKRISDVLQEGVDADGGYLVPDEYDKRLIKILEEENIVRRIAHKITTSGDHKINIAATSPAAAWIEEGEALSFGDATFDQKNLDAHKLSVAIKITNELLYDSAFPLENHILTEFGKALSNAEEDAFLNGDGSGKPTGIFNATKGGIVAKTLTAAISSDDLIDLVYALKRPYRKNAAFIMNDKTVAQIRKLKDTNNVFLWQESLQAGEPARLLGYEVFTSGYAPEDAIAFGDFSYYNIGDRGARSFQELRELFAGNDMTALVAKERVDGILVLPEAVQILKLKTTKTSTSTT